MNDMWFPGFPALSLAVLLCGCGRPKAPPAPVSADSSQSSPQTTERRFLPPYAGALWIFAQHAPQKGDDELIVLSAYLLLPGQGLAQCLDLLVRSQGDDLYVVSRRIHDLWPDKLRKPLLARVLAQAEYRSSAADVPITFPQSDKPTVLFLSEPYSTNGVSMLVHPPMLEGWQSAGSDMIKPVAGGRGLSYHTGSIGELCVQPGAHVVLGSRQFEGNVLVCSKSKQNILFSPDYGPLAVYVHKRTGDSAEKFFRWGKPVPQCQNREYPRWALRMELVYCHLPNDNTEFANAEYVLRDANGLRFAE